MEGCAFDDGVSGYLPRTAWSCLIVVLYRYSNVPGTIGLGRCLRPVL